MHRALVEMWRLDDLAAERCLCHSDGHMGNTYFNADGRIGLVDWQGVAIAPNWDDVSNIIGGSMTIADRRAHERDLLRHYLDVLSANGGPRVAFDDAWLQYRRYHMHGILWAVTPASMQDGAKVTAMTERHMAAIIDHDVVALLENH
jgi:aminoglycoside phosphotransferase (APT) family kinase protein